MSNACKRVLATTVFVSLVLGADAVSGQTRENATAADRASAREPVANAAGKAVVEIFALPRGEGDNVVPRAELPNAKPRVANAEARGSGIKNMFKELRPGSCRSGLLRPANTSWPARGEPAIAFCQP